MNDSLLSNIASMNLIYLKTGIYTLYNLRIGSDEVNCLAEVYTDCFGPV